MAERGTPEYEQALIAGVYDQRAALVARLARNASRPADRRTFNNILTHRYPQERQDALDR